MSGIDRRGLIAGMIGAPISAQAATFAGSDGVPRHLPGELPADAVLNGAYPYPPSPRLDPGRDRRGFAAHRVGRTPRPGVHPRIFFTREDLPDIRQRLAHRRTGRAVAATARAIVAGALHKPGDWRAMLFGALAGGRLSEAQALIDAHGFPAAIGHYKPWLYALVLDALLALIDDDAARGRAAATALASYATLIAPGVAAALDEPLNDDVWRVKISGSRTGTTNEDQGMRDLLGYHLLGYGYDFAYGWMTPSQRDAVRGLIARVTHGRLWEGARLPHHFRNWNHIMVALSQPLLALAIEGEPGYDPRVFRLGVEMARDYLTYSTTPRGMSNEAIGYIQFGYVWGNPFLAAAARRGHDLLSHGHARAMLDWYVHCLTPAGDGWVSRGDGGDTGPAPWTMAYWLHFFPGDPRVRFLFDAMQRANPRAWTGDSHLIETMIWADDVAEPVDTPAALALPPTLYEPVRGGAIARTGWTADAAMVTFECRIDSHCASHEHADRGSFTFHALGRTWAKDNFRSVETRHHNGVLIDGKGQGYWPGPGAWLHFADNADQMLAVADLKPAYDWQWPKQILTEPDDHPMFRYERWADYRAQARLFRERHPDVRLERDDRPAVVAHWQGFTAGDPRMWDEDGWPVRMPFNPVERAKRSILFRKGASPWLIVADDMRKDGHERLYEWLMQTGTDIEIDSLDRGRIVLVDRTTPRRRQRRLFVLVLDMAEPARFDDYAARPSIRLETFERRDTLEPVSSPMALAGSRSFGLDRRLVIGSRSVAPNFRILLYPLAEGAPLPAVEWVMPGARLAIAQGKGRDLVDFARVDDHLRMGLVGSAAG